MYSEISVALSFVPNLGLYTRKVRANTENFSAPPVQRPVKLEEKLIL